MKRAEWFRDAPIKSKLLWIGLLTFGFALLFVSLILTVRDVVEWRNRTVAELRTYARVIGANAVPAMLFDDRKAAAETLSALSAKPDIVHAVIYDRQGKEFASYQESDHAHYPLPSSGIEEHRFTFDSLTISSPVSFKDEALGSISLEADLRGLYMGVMRGIGLIFLAAFGVFLLAASLFARLQKIIVAPIQDMAGAMQGVITEQNFAARVAVHGKDEAGMLAGTFNIMLEYIQLRDADLEQHRAHLEEEVAQRTARLTEAQRLAHLGDWEWDIADNRLDWSDEIYRIFGLAPQQFCATYEAFLQAVHPEDRQRVDTCVREALEQNRPYSIDHRIVLPDGTVRHVHEQAEVSRDGEGQPVKMHGTVQDITGQMQAEQELRIAATAFETQEGIMITGRDGRILRVNYAFTRLTGYSASEAIGKTPAMLQSGRQDAEFYRNLWERLIRDKYWHGEIWNKRKNGEIYPEWITITAVSDAGGQVTHYVAVFSDITQRKQNEDEIYNLAFYDPLTKLPNRRLLMDRLSHTMASGARSVEYAALMFIDLDNFKMLNDTQGHDVGDLLLIETAWRLQDCVREGDTVARLGGDEFVVMLEGLSEEVEQAAIQAEAVGEKIRAVLNQPYLLKDFKHHSSSSIGICLFHGRDVAVDELLKRADMAMYEAKTSGRNALRFFDPAMQADLEERSSLEADLRRAVSEQEQFLLYYQPQVDSSGHMVGAEALVRWQHPERGMVSPAEFIPLAEETGLILPLGHWVMSTACRQLAAWATQPEMAHLTVAVNVSAKQFHLPTFVEEVLALVDYFGVNPARLKLEITESLLLGKVDDTIAKMTALKARGINFSMDDFGTGYSSLSYLKRLPLYQLKIDQSFVREVLTDSNDAAIAKIIVALARSMDLTVIAEGVEIEEQRAFLEQNGCHAYQGYLFGKPVPAKEFEELLARYS